MWSDSQLLAMHKAPVDAGVIPHFFLTEEQDPDATKREGRPVSKSVEMIEILIPANPKTKPVYRVRDEHREKYADAYAKCKAKQEQRPDGTPLEQWPYLSRLRVMELKAINIYTVEQLAGLSDQQLQKVGSDGLEIQKRARQFLQPEGATLKEVRAENLALKDRLAAAEAAIAQLQGIKSNKKAADE